MNEIASCNPHLTVRDGHPVASSRRVAESFGRRHDDVLKAISRADCSTDFRARNFAAATYRDAQGKPRPAVEMTRDGFVFVVMGFTGATAARWKEAYITAFNRMEQQLAEQRPAAPVLVPADELARTRAELLDTQRMLIEAQASLLKGARARKPRAAPRPLTEADIAQMRKLRAEGVPTPEIARRLQRSTATVSMMTREVTS